MSSLRLRERCDRLPLIVALALYTVVVLRCAWISDDAYITFRTVDNFVAGRGLVWNVAERVQTFTHPLWALLLAAAYALTREIHLTTIALSVALSVFAVLLYAGALAPTPLAATVGVTIFLMSKAFVDYSTSGLENPLSHALLALFLLVYGRAPLSNRRLFALALFAGLLVVNRLDLLLLVLPALAAAWYERRSLRAAGLIVLGFLPLLVWEAVALIYYGFLLPNTAYAKLNTSLPAGALAKQGLLYLVNSLDWDPLTPIVIAAGLALPWCMRQRRCLPLSVGMAVYLVYVVAIGGDFMAGRFFTAVLLVAVVVVSRSPAAHAPRALLVVLALVICAGLVSPRAPLRSSLECTIGQPHFDPHGIADERAYYHAATGLLPAARGVRVPDHQWAAAGRAARAQGPAVLVADNIGFFGYEAGIAVHVVDRLALADPLLARLPYQATANWRVGHYPRELPQGYLETLRSGHNQITDPRTRRLYDALALVTRGPLLDPQRWTMIIRLNLLGQP